MRVRRLARLRESVATSAAPQLKRGRDDNESLRERDFSDEQRITMAKAGHAIPVRDENGVIVGGRYPIETAEDVRNAVEDANRTGAGTDVREHIIRQADRVGATHQIPKGWRKRSAREAVAFTVRVAEAITGKQGKAYDATVIREGPGNPNDRNAYSKEALRQAVTKGLFEGLQAYANHPTVSEERERPERDVRQLVGHFREARFVDGNPAEVRAKFVPITGPGYEWVTSLIESALAAPKGRPLIGISIDGYGDAPDTQEIAGRKYNIVREITHLGSAAIVTRAGAGGQFHRRLSESLAGVRERPVAMELTAKKLQKRVREALEQLGDALAREDDDLAERALAALHEASAATVQPVVKIKRADPDATTDPEELKRLREKLAKERHRRKRAQERASTADRAATANRILREVAVPTETKEAWLADLIDQADEASMRQLLDRRLNERAAYLDELREAYGLNEGVVGAGPRNRDSGGAARSGLLERLGLDPDELQGA